MRTSGGGSGPGSSPPPCSRTMSQRGDGPCFVPARSYVSSERPQTTLCRDAVLAWPSSSRLPVEPTAPAATPAMARWVEAMGTEPRSSDDCRSGAGSKYCRRRSWDTTAYRVVKGFGFPDRGCVLSGRSRTDEPAATGGGCFLSGRHPKAGMMPVRSRSVPQCATAAKRRTRSRAPGRPPGRNRPEVSSSAAIAWPWSCTVPMTVTQSRGPLQRPPSPFQ
jgi:hypothetical protein